MECKPIDNVLKGILEGPVPPTELSNLEQAVKETMWVVLMALKAAGANSRDADMGAYVAMNAVAVVAVASICHNPHNAECSDMMEKLTKLADKVSNANRGKR